MLQRVPLRHACGAFQTVRASAVVLEAQAGFCAEHGFGIWEENPGSWQRGFNLVPRFHVLTIVVLRGDAAQRIHDWGSVVLVESIAEVQLADGARPLLNSLLLWLCFPFIKHLQQECAPRGAVRKASCALYEIGDGGGEEKVRIPLQLMHNQSRSAPPESRATTQRPDVNAVVFEESKAACTAAARSVVTVPTLRCGISFWGPVVGHQIHTHRHQQQLNMNWGLYNIRQALRG